MRFRVLIAIFCFQLGFAQTTNPEEQPQEVANDTLIDGQTQIIKAVEPIADTLEKKRLEDHDLAAEFDKKWRAELYSMALYDTIYKTVSEMEYEEVYYPELPTDTLKKRLAELNARTPFNIEYNPSLESVIKSYLKHRRKSLEKLMALSAYYFPLFEKELDNHNIPLEIKYLAIVESALKPRAKSRVGATGLWQFMYQTGKMYDLNVSSYVDDRQESEETFHVVFDVQLLKILYWDIP